MKIRKPWDKPMTRKGTAAGYAAMIATSPICGTLNAVGDAATVGRAAWRTRGQGADARRAAVADARRRVRRSYYVALVLTMVVVFAFVIATVPA